MKKCFDLNLKIDAYWKDDEPISFSFFVGAWELIGKELGWIIGVRWMPLRLRVPRLLIQMKLMVR